MTTIIDSEPAAETAAAQLCPFQYQIQHELMLDQRRADAHSTITRIDLPANLARRAHHEHRVAYDTTMALALRHGLACDAYSLSTAIETAQAESPARSTARIEAITTACIQLLHQQMNAHNRTCLCGQA